MSLNQIMLIGNTGTDPELRYTPNGAPVTDFRLAVNYRRSGGQDGEQQDETEWFTVTCWNRQAETVSQYLTKGQRVFVEGRFRSRSFVGNDGQNRTVNEVIANRVLFLDRPGEGGDYPVPSEGGFSRQAPSRSRPAQAEEEDVEELPW